MSCHSRHCRGLVVKCDGALLTAKQQLTQGTQAEFACVIQFAACLVLFMNGEGIRQVMTTLCESDRSASWLGMERPVCSNEGCAVAPICAARRSGSQCHLALRILYEHSMQSRFKLK